MCSARPRITPVLHTRPEHHQEGGGTRLAQADGLSVRTTAQKARRLSQIPGGRLAPVRVYIYTVGRKGVCVCVWHTHAHALPRAGVDGHLSAVRPRGSETRRCRPGNCDRAQRRPVPLRRLRRHRRSDYRSSPALAIALCLCLAQAVRAVGIAAGFRPGMLRPPTPLVRPTLAFR